MESKSDRIGSRSGASSSKFSKGENESALSESKLGDDNRSEPKGAAHAESRASKSSTADEKARMAEIELDEEVSSYYNSFETRK